MDKSRNYNEHYEIYILQLSDNDSFLFVKLKWCLEVNL